MMKRSWRLDQKRVQPLGPLPVGQKTQKQTNEPRQRSEIWNTSSLTHPTNYGPRAHPALLHIWSGPLNNIRDT